MRHPNQATLALHAGGDLGKIARWRVERHLAKCEACAGELAAYEQTRQMVAGLEELPEIPWNVLAAEMKANIRLGLAAGECVRSGEAPLRSMAWFSRTRAALACAGVVALIGMSLVLQVPKPAPVAAATPMVEATDHGIRLSAGDAAVGLLNPGVRVENVSYMPNAQGGISASYVDPATGRLTVNTVYGQ